MDCPIHIWSDLHLKHPCCDVAGIRRAQTRIEKDGGKIVAAGDIVDLRFASRGSVDVETRDILRWMRERLIATVPGNHDAPLVQPPIFEGQRYPHTQLLIDGRVWYIEHGHLIGRWGWLFKFLDRYDEKTKFRKIARWVTKHDFLARAGSSRSADPAFKFDAIDRCKLKGGTVAIIGHSHKPEIYRDCTGQFEVTYVNPGSAIDCFTYATYSNNKFTLEGKQ